MEPEAAYERLWQEIERILRLDEPDPVAAWEARLAQLGGDPGEAERACGSTTCITSAPAPT